MIDNEMAEITFFSSLDGSAEKALFYRGKEGSPVVVGLHTWSYDRYNQRGAMLPPCRQRGWSLLLPEFRGPNLESNPRARQACASTAALQDVYDATHNVAERFGAGGNGVFLLGGSGGGHMSLMLAARRPAFWSGVSSWVPITDLAAWHGENPDYARHIEACCGGAPGSSAEVDRQLRERSPLNYVAELAAVNLSLHHGRFDTVVPYRQSWRLAQALEEAGAENFFFEIFSGGHDIRYQVAFDWFDSLVGSGGKGGSALTG